MSRATKANVLVRLRYLLGDFVRRPDSGRYWPGVVFNDELGDAVRGCFTTGDKGTPRDNIIFLVSEFVKLLHAPFLRELTTRS